jgi:hypothetical protein
VIGRFLLNLLTGFNGMREKKFLQVLALEKAFFAEGLEVRDNPAMSELVEITMRAFQERRRFLEA